MMQVKMRQAQYCNLKMFLMILVIYGHLIESRIGASSSLMTQYKVIYMIHMPLFVFLSGLFLKTESACLKQAIWAFKTYLICQSIMIIIEKAMGHEKNLWMTPYWHLWYLLSLVYWSFIAYGWHWLVRHIPKANHIAVKVFLIISTIGISCLAGGYQEINRFLSASRTIVFLPYLLAGVFCPIHINWKKYRSIAVILGAISIRFIVLYKNKISYTFLYHASYYGKLTFATGVKRRIICYIIAVGLGLLLLTFFPTKRMAWSKVGVDTKWIYIFHAPIIAFLRQLEIPLEIFEYIAPAIAIYVLWILYKIFQWQAPLCGIRSYETLSTKSKKYRRKRNVLIRWNCK